MPDPSSLRPGDRVRIVSVPGADLQALASGATHLEGTVRVLQWMVGREYAVAWIDEDGKPWLVVDYPDPEGGQHSVALTDALSWEHARPKLPDGRRG